MIYLHQQVCEEAIKFIGVIEPMQTKISLLSDRCDSFQQQIKELNTKKQILEEENLKLKERVGSVEGFVEEYQKRKKEKTEKEKIEKEKIEKEKFEKEKFEKEKDEEIFLEQYDHGYVEINKLGSNCFTSKRKLQNGDQCNMRTNKISGLRKKIFYAKVTTLLKVDTSFCGVQNVDHFKLSGSIYGKGINFLNRSSSQLYGKDVGGDSTKTKIEKVGDSTLMKVDFEKDKITFEDKNGNKWSDTLSKYVDTSSCCFSFVHLRNDSEFKIEFSNKRISF